MKTKQSTSNSVLTHHYWLATVARAVHFSRTLRRALSCPGISPILPNKAPTRRETIAPMVESIFLACSLITSCIQLGGWAVAYALRTEKFYDILGGLNFLAVAAFSAATAEGWEADPRKVPLPYSYPHSSPSSSPDPDPNFEL